MDERRPATRRPPAVDGPLTVLGLAALALVTLATVALAGASLQDDPLGTVTSSRLIPELVIAAVVATVLVGLTLWLVLPSSPSPGRGPNGGHSPWWSRPLGLAGWFVLVALLVLLAQRMSSGTDEPAPDGDVDPATLVFVSVRAPTGDGSPQTVDELDRRLPHLDAVRATFTGVAVRDLEQELGPVVPTEAAAGGAEVVVARLARPSDALDEGAAADLAALVDDIDRASPATVTIVDRDGVPLELPPPPADERRPSPAASGSSIIDVAIAVGSVVVALVVAAGLVVALLRRRERGQGLDLPMGDALAGPLGPDARTDADLRAALRRAHDGLVAGDDPRLAIIGAYWQMEQAMADAGVPPLPAETSREFLDRCVDAMGPGSDAARRLTQLFEWAMFSQHPLGSAQRDDARAALLDIIEGLDRTRTWRAVSP